MPALVICGLLPAGAARWVIDANSEMANGE